MKKLSQMLELTNFPVISFQKLVLLANIKTHQKFKVIESPNSKTIQVWINKYETLTRSDCA